MVDHVMESKKNSAISFLELAASGRARDAFAKYVGTGFRHHNPFFAGDAQALMTGMEENARQNPDKRLDVLRALEDGDLVAVHSHVRQKSTDRGAVVVHLFRFEGERIVELWDVGQPVPAESVHPNGML
jgi:predicted SnoaL-like aldol condensation-catalyzing enzyme